MAQISTLVEHGVIRALCDVLQVEDAKIVCLDALDNILKKGAINNNNNNNNMFTSILEECGGIDVLEGLQSDANEVVYEKSSSLLLRFFAVEDDEGDEGGKFFDGPAEINNERRFAFS